VEFRILGPLEVVDDGESFALGAVGQRALLAVLLLHRGEVVSIDRLIDELWGEAPPATAAKTAQVYVSHLRRVLGSGVIVTAGRGYRLAVERKHDHVHGSENEQAVIAERERRGRGQSRADPLPRPPPALAAPSMQERSPASRCVPGTSRLRARGQDACATTNARRGLTRNKRQPAWASAAGEQLDPVGRALARRSCSTKVFEPVGLSCHGELKLNTQPLPGFPGHDELNGEVRAICSIERRSPTASNQ
jgi:DNA-binding winged helix-turn-helix (wHTH) protein